MDDLDRIFALGEDSLTEEEEKKQRLLNEREKKVQEEIAKARQGLVFDAIEQLPSAYLNYLVFPEDDLRPLVVATVSIELPQCVPFSAVFARDKRWQFSWYELPKIIIDEMSPFREPRLVDRCFKEVHPHRAAALARRLKRQYEAEVERSQAERMAYEQETEEMVEQGEPVYLPMESHTACSQEDLMPAIRHMVREEVETTLQKYGLVA